MKSKEELSVEVALNMWNQRVKQVDKQLESFTDEQLLKEIAPNKNRGIYILGHLTALHDQIITILGLGERLYPLLDKIFVGVPDKSVPEMPSVTDIRSYFKNINETLTNHFTNLPLNEWFERHNSVSAEDFVKEPHRNKLAILISRTNHFSYHAGQLTLLK